jgi:hypothetical protein
VRLIPGAGKSGVTLHAHADVLAAASPALESLLRASPALAAATRRVDVIERVSSRAHPLLRACLHVILYAMHALAVFATFAARDAARWAVAAYSLSSDVAKPREKTLVFPDLDARTMTEMLRWIYRVPLHPPVDALCDLHAAATKYEIDGLAAYARRRLRRDADADACAGAAKIARDAGDAKLWSVAVRRARRDWAAVRVAEGFHALVREDAEAARAFTLAVHSTIQLASEGLDQLL